MYVYVHLIATTYICKRKIYTNHKAKLKIFLSCFKDFLFTSIYLQNKNKLKNDELVLEYFSVN